MNVTPLQKPSSQPFALVDSHAHMDADAFDDDRADVLERAADAGVSHIVVPATTAARWPLLAAICDPHPALHAAFGLHPMFLDEHREAHLASLPTWLHEHQAVAVGECGLDFHIDDPRPDRQRMYFQRQLDVARELDLPVIVHARKAVEEVIHSVRKAGPLRGVVHSFSGSREQARQLADLGFLIGIGGPVTYDRAKRLRRTVADIPLDTLLLETDAPDQPDAHHRGQRNEPARLPEILQCIADLRDEDAQAIAAATRNNAMRLFGFSGS
ncbi:MAG TPA: TatD family hydrolase [Rhodanobacteraceae bacterium]|nr:TatD family hydrolase [Rhodanobacteraceae bacterium]